MRDEVNKGIISVDFPRTKLCPYNKFEKRDKIKKSHIEQRKKYLLFLRGVEKTPRWNAGVWFVVSRKDEIISRIKDSKSFEIEVELSHDICPYCHNELKEEDLVKSISMDLKYFSTLNTTSKKSHIVKEIVNSVKIHTECTDDLYKEINQKSLNSVASWLSDN